MKGGFRVNYVMEAFVFSVLLSVAAHTQVNGSAFPSRLNRSFLLPLADDLPSPCDSQFTQWELTRIKSFHQLHLLPAALKTLLPLLLPCETKPLPSTSHLPKSFPALEKPTTPNPELERSKPGCLLIRSQSRLFLSQRP